MDKTIEDVLKLTLKVGAFADTSSHDLLILLSDTFDKRLKQEIAKSCLPMYKDMAEEITSIIDKNYSNSPTAQHLKRVIQGQIDFFESKAEVYLK